MLRKMVNNSANINKKSPKTGTLWAFNITKNHNEF